MGKALVKNDLVNSSHLVSKVQREVTSILDEDAKNNQSQQETECFFSLMAAWLCVSTVEAVALLLALIK